jgi:CheY-like chemotaxis protein
MVVHHKILIADDDADDIEMLKSALKETGHAFDIIEANDGVEAIDRLQQLYDGGELPCLIVLDINMPRMNGMQTFLNIKANENFAFIPIVILSTSTYSEDLSFFLGRNARYFIKPINYKGLVETAATILNLCLKHSKFQ